MNRATILDRVKRNEAGLTALGLQHVSLFGSTARGEASDASDVDLVVEPARSARMQAESIGTECLSTELISRIAFRRLPDQSSTRRGHAIQII